MKNLRWMVLCIAASAAVFAQEKGGAPVLRCVVRSVLRPPGDARVLFFFAAIFDK